MNVVSPLANWIPYRLEYIDQDWLVHWLYLGDKRMDDPFLMRPFAIAERCKEECRGLRAAVVPNCLRLMI